MKIKKNALIFVLLFAFGMHQQTFSMQNTQITFNNPMLVKIVACLAIVYVGVKVANWLFPDANTIYDKQGNLVTIKTKYEDHETISTYFNKNNDQIGTVHENNQGKLTSLIFECPTVICNNSITITDSLKLTGKSTVSNITGNNKTVLNVGGNTVGNMWNDKAWWQGLNMQ